MLEQLIDHCGDVYRSTIDVPAEILANLLSVHVYGGEVEIELATSFELNYVTGTNGPFHFDKIAYQLDDRSFEGIIMYREALVSIDEYTGINRLGVLADTNGDMTAFYYPRLAFFFPKQKYAKVQGEIQYNGMGVPEMVRWFSPESPLVFDDGSAGYCKATFSNCLYSTNSSKRSITLWVGNQIHMKYGMPLRADQIPRIMGTVSNMGVDWDPVIKVLPAMMELASSAYGSFVDKKVSKPQVG